MNAAGRAPLQIAVDIQTKLGGLESYAQKAEREYTGVSKTIMKLVGYIRDLFTRSSDLENAYSEIRRDIQELSALGQEENLPWNELADAVQRVDLCAKQIMAKAFGGRRYYAEIVDRQLTGLENQFRDCYRLRDEPPAVSGPLLGAAPESAGGISPRPE